MVDDELKLVYSHYDRVIVGGAKPIDKTIELKNPSELRADYFLQRRELGIINVGGAGKITVDGESFELGKLDCLYIGKGKQKIVFSSDSNNSPAVFYLLSTPAHAEYPIQFVANKDAENAVLGSLQTSNERTIYRYIHENGAKSCQLVMGLTILNKGSVWNTMPAHTHTRRMEAYFYFDVPSDQRVFHLMGEPTETRHIVTANHEAVVSPPWSIHSGCGTSNYGFIWGMGGENYTYSDMDAVAIGDLK
ncbi:MAG: 5-dehydro-4-deoxy-D-glucuronate isomerase [Pseudopedobacter saltans]|uniref:5-dehydro-4-deoxy-D-glucuronate isomerase n=1 Tax=Pseudopedobacter saltans TaxID=151895 RepID=A0A2W5F8R9_9SPHI|nr:MAG: 5-dehydro-4-deoxy-D-glucuronate isomerase [Pseudopedobacter saltans]